MPLSLLVGSFIISILGSNYVLLEDNKCPEEHKYGMTYPSLELAQNACSNDQECGFIYDEGCRWFGGKLTNYTFSLCKILPPKQLVSDNNECVYQDKVKGKSYEKDCI